MFSKRKILIFTSLLLFLLVFCGASSAATVNVHPGTNAVKNAINTAHSGDTLNLSAGTYNEHDILVNKNLTITGPTVTGNNLPTAVVDAQKMGRVFNISAGVNVTLKYLLIQNGNATTDIYTEGGGIYNQGSLNIKNCTIQKNSATQGGGIYNEHGIVTLTYSNVSENIATGGGGIWNSYGTLTLTYSNVYSNNADGYAGSGSGGGIYNEWGDTTLTGSNVYNNHAANSGGGGINIANGIVTLINSNVYMNNADSEGGGIYKCLGTLTLTNSNVYDNIGQDAAGGIYNYEGDVTLTDSKVYNNTVIPWSDYVITFGGGIYNTELGTVTLTNSYLYNNKAFAGIYNSEYGSAGGGIYNMGNMTLRYCSIIGNAANRGTDIYCETQGQYNKGTVDARYNWWGSDSNPSSKVSGKVNITPWLVSNPAPTVTTVDPANNAVNVPPNKVIKVTFSQPIKNVSGGIELKNSTGTLIPITTSISGYVLTIYHAALLTNGKYTVVLHTGSVANLAGNNLVAYSTSFTVDSTPPTITIVDPANNAVKVARNKVIKLTFNENIIAAAGSKYWIELKASNGTSVNIGKSISGKVLTITHSAILAANTKYTLILHTGSVTDLAGNPVALKSFKFSVGASPTVSSSNPVSGATKVARNKTITVTFNENIKAGSNYGKITLKSSTGKTVTITKSISGKVLTIKHSSLLASNTKYALTLYSGCVTDLAGNPVAAKTITFTTGSS